MIKQLSNTIASFLVQEKIVNKEDKEIYQFGTEQILINLITFSVVIIVAIKFGLYSQVFFFFIGILPIRMTAGGYHAKTPKACSLITLTIFIGNLYLIQKASTCITYPILMLMILIVDVAVFRYSPLENENIKISPKRLEKYKNQSRWITVLISSFLLINMIINSKPSITLISIMFGALTASISLIIGARIKGGEQQ